MAVQRWLHSRALLGQTGRVDVDQVREEGGQWKNSFYFQGDKITNMNGYQILPKQ